MLCELIVAALAAAATLTLWDHVLTLGREFQLLWRRPWAPLQHLLLANRYGAILGMLLIVKSKSLNSRHCRVVQDSSWYAVRYRLEWHVMGDE